MSLGDLTIKKKHIVQTRKRTQGYSTQHTRKQIQELSTIALQARVRPWLYQQETHWCTPTSRGTCSKDSKREDLDDGRNCSAQKFFNVRAISENLPVCSLFRLLPFHALTGCNSTSFLCDQGKTLAWEMFSEKHNLLSSLCEGNLTTTKIKDTEKFMCAMHKHEEVESVNQIRVLLFPKFGKLKGLPPTGDALELHIRRFHYQSLVWK